MDDYKRGYEQALKDINTSMSVITENCNPSECLRCNQTNKTIEEGNEKVFRKKVFYEVFN